MQELPPVVQAKLLVILHRALVQARNLDLAGELARLVDLADTFEVLPELFRRDGTQAIGPVRAILSEYQSRQPGGGYDYLSILDMDEAAFEVTHGTTMQGGPDAGAA